MEAAPSALERAAVDAVVGAPVSSANDHVGFGGLRAAAAKRHLLLPALHALQDEVGWISPGGLNHVCDVLSVPPAEAFGVATFYALLATEERPARVAHVCDDIVCASRGGTAILDALGDRDDVHSSPCLGRCEGAPAVFLQIAGASNETLIGATADEVLAALERRPVVAAEPAPPAAPQTAGDGEDLRLLSRVGRIDPTSLDDYRSHGGYRGLAAAAGMTPEGVIAEIEASGLRGRGGAAFPAASKWEAAASAADPIRYVVCNADESEPGTFKDRVLLEDDPFAVVEGLTIAAHAVGAEHAFVYIRGEYPLAEERITAAIAAARAAGLLDLDVEVRRGAGAYICGEETALFNSIEGRRGEPRQKPPFPTQAGLFGRPTLVNNVETLACVPWIVAEGGAAFAATGTEGSTGPKLFSISGDVAVPGVYEVEFGTTVAELVALAGGATGTTAAVLVGGAAGAFLLPAQLEVPLTFEGTRAAGIPLGSGSIVVFGERTDFPAVVRRIARFFADESCGQCVPCRVGTVRQVEALDRLSAGGDEVGTLADLEAVMRDASICGLGQFAAGAVQSALRLGLIGVGP